MKIYKTKTITEEKIIFDKLVCDICKRESNHRSWASGFDVDETEVKVSIKHRTGESYPEGGWGDKIEVDICPECFDNKLIPWLRSEGVEIEETEWDW